MRKTKYNWTEVQQYYDSGHTWQELSDHFGLASASIHKAIKRGDFHSRNYSLSGKLSWSKKRRPPHSQETKDKISISRIKYLTEHPDKVPYIINHSSKKSWPEQVFENALNSSDITGWKYNFRNGIYQYDFAWPDLKIDVEIDGGTHKLEKVIAIDERRDKFSNSQGWVVLRFTASKIKSDVVGCVNELKYLLTNRKKSVECSYDSPNNYQ